MAFTYEPPMAGWTVFRSAPVAVSKAAKLNRVAPLTWLNDPPTYSREPSGDSARALTVPLIFGANDVATPVLMSYARMLERGISPVPAAAPAGRAFEKLPPA